jgi:Tfp pilus assembly protein PilF/ribosome biogenesis GTPase A
MGIWDRVSRTLDELSEGLLPDDVRDGVEGARLLLERGQTDAAAAAIEEILRKKPDHATAQLLLGVARLRQGDPKRAGAAFVAAIAQRAGFAEAYVGLGKARLDAGDAKSALSAFRDAALHAGGARDTLAAAYLGLGRAYAALGEHEKSVRELRKSLLEAPGDAEAVAALAEELLGGADADLDEARAPLEKACARPDAPAAALVAFGRLELHSGRVAEAIAVLERALAGTAAATLTPSLRGAALVALADALARRGDFSGAHQRLLEALSVAPSADVHLRLARVQRAVGSVEAALAACEAAAARAVGTPAEADAWALALEIALDANRIDRAAQAGNALLARAPAHPLRARALAARGAALAAAGETDLARTAIAQAIAAGDTVDAPLALAWLQLPDDPALAAEEARRVLARVPRDSRARELLVAARRRSLVGEGAPPAELHVLASAVVALTRAAPELSGFAAAAAEAFESYDRPLLLTVMGEFSSGKSTFVNALLGAEVAPVGVTPTTATINILKYGRDKRGRIVYRDDRERELRWDDIGPTLRALTPSEASSIRFVELLYPLEALERVSIVDTPGLNSILPEHEATARQFIAQADAVVWLFTALQAGKASEREALERIRGEGKRVLGVVNKIDQASEDERAQLFAHLERELGGNLVEALVPVSARRALAARARNDEAALAAAAWPALEAALEERFFTQARAIKRAACGKRLGLVLEGARARIATLSDEATRAGETLQQAATAARADAEIFRRGTVPEEARGLAERLASAYRSAAREVLDVVRPRKLPFGANQATAADRDYLVALLERAFTAILEPTRRRSLAELGRAADEAALAARAWNDEAAVELRRAGADAALLVDARVFDRFAAFLRGFLRGGSIDDFFNRTLPRLTLDEDAVYHALVRDAPDLKEELTVPLAEAGEAALRAHAARLAELAAHAELRRHELDEALAATVDAYATALAKALAPPAALPGAAS